MKTDDKEAAEFRFVEPVFVSGPGGEIYEELPKLGDRKIIGDKVVEFDGKNWREPASGRIVA
jgi:hypothetical protein